MQVSVKQVEASAVFCSVDKSHSEQTCQVRIKWQIPNLCNIHRMVEPFVCDSGVGCRSQTRVPVAAKWAGWGGRALLVRNAVDYAD